MYKKIIVAVDVSALDRGERILTRAAGLLSEGGRIVLLSVVEDLPGYILAEVPVSISKDARADAREKLSDLSRRLGVAADIEVRQGPPAHEILSAAQALDADLVIIASHKPDLSNYFIGATADRVVRHSKCSVLVDR